VTEPRDYGKPGGDDKNSPGRHHHGLGDRLNEVAADAELALEENWDATRNISKNMSRGLIIFVIFFEI